ncbi:dihydrolipoyl dehydrogenase [Rickettsia endosymbiont of Cardiosporidium cionae]|uniref:dihydrolipoyl dehydrogenase n=1 Tax=Rickettsia endosymbiont of Cardiosporidium cionae TaxID=2777155 RepID=UPI00189331AE|nr:dihydrolipoyl dehydrogenase [Rickettsia endosymbiont of Cardiosporidium cionae]KAF8818792.1 dihydrolipoyl dehydrogenase [Rickettsia endosymbiont of Cardiosporidium cionae]
MKDYEVVVIGGGPGGYVAAIKSAQLGKKTAIIEQNQLGGVCLHQGCIPTKSLLKCSELITSIKNAEKYGIKVGQMNFDIHSMVDYAKNISENLESGIRSLMKKNMIDVIKARAKIHDTKNSHKIISIFDKNNNSIGNIKSKNIIIATGAKPKELSGYEIDGKYIWNYQNALKPDKLPESMLIVGSGAIGIEFASFYNSLGVKVTVLEAKNDILHGIDQEIAAIAKKEFISKNIAFITGIKLNKKEILNDEVYLHFSQNNKIETTLKAKVLLMAVGVTPNINNIGLENTKVKLHNCYIITDKNMETDEKSIYAIGDVVSMPWLAHKASHEGKIAAEHIAGNNPTHIKHHNIPNCIYSTPEIASVGLTETEAKTLGYKLKIGKFPAYANGKSLILDNKQGLIKTIFDSDTGELLGAHMIGVGVTELIHGYVIAKELESTHIELINTIFPHPTLSEMLHESVLNAYEQSIHI